MWNGQTKKSNKKKEEKFGSTRPGAGQLHCVYRFTRFEIAGVLFVSSSELPQYVYAYINIRIKIRSREHGGHGQRKTSERTFIR